MSANESLVSSLRQEIERKYRDALQALETLSAYLASHQTPAIQSVATTTQPAKPSGRSQVDTVLSAIDDFKSVEKIVQETGLADAAVRAVLYSKHLKAKIQRRKAGKITEFKRATVAGKKAAGDKTVTAASLVRSALAKHPQGLTTAQIMETIADDLKRINGNANAVGAALYNMKDSGKVLRDETTGAYRLAAQAL